MLQQSIPHHFGFVPTMQPTLVAEPRMAISGSTRSSMMDIAPSYCWTAATVSRSLAMGMTGPIVTS